MKRKADGDRERGVVQELKTQQDANQSGAKRNETRQTGRLSEPKLESACKQVQSLR